MHWTRHSKGLADGSPGRPSPLMRSSLSHQFSPTSSATYESRRVWVPSNVKPRRCPRCQSQATYRSARRGFFESLLLSALPMRPFRCRACDLRFYGFFFRRHSLHFNGSERPLSD